MFFLARRFVAGLTREEALTRAREIQKSGFLATIDHLGEHVTDVKEARAATDEYVELLDAIHSTNGNAPQDPMPTDPTEPGEHVNLSVKPTHVGLDISEEEALNNMRKIVSEAKQFGSLVRLDMEGSPYTEKTLKLAKRLQDELGNHVGVVIQAYLFRSHDDIDNMIHSKTRVRLCKGAYKESPDIALTKHSQVNSNFDKLTAMLMEHGYYPAIATHDENRVRNAITYARQFNRSPKEFEFQMLLGARESLARELIKSGFRVRLYLPYGRDWARYYYRRIRERKENLYFALSSLLRS